mgnify:CR=1 FL=1|jgi:hypothetical protein|tara:strand:+ start:683 stop:865 length:183 start_codon:yes stop_codon:yes gene_type:complete
MTLYKLSIEAEVKLRNGWSMSRIIDFVFQNANNGAQANKILDILLALTEDDNLNYSVPNK